MRFRIEEPARGVSAPRPTRGRPPATPHVLEGAGTIGTAGGPGAVSISPSPEVRDLVGAVYRPGRQLRGKPVGRAAASAAPPSISLLCKPGAARQAGRGPLPCRHYLREVGPPPSTFGTRISTFRFTRTTGSFARSASGRWPSTASPSAAWFDGQSGGVASARQLRPAPGGPVVSLTAGPC